MLVITIALFIVYDFVVGISCQFCRLCGLFKSHETTCGFTQTFLHLIPVCL